MVRTPEFYKKLKNVIPNCGLKNFRLLVLVRTVCRTLAAGRLHRLVVRPLQESGSPVRAEFDDLTSTTQAVLSVADTASYCE